MLFESQVFTGNWSTLVWRGIVAILFGVMILVWPAMSIGVLLWLVGIVAIAGGLLVLIQAVRTKGGWPLILEGVLSIVIGILVATMPGMSALFIILLIGFWVIIIGLFQILNVIQFYKAIPNPGKWLIILNGIVSILFGAIILSRPLLGVLLIASIIGIYALLFGVISFFSGLYIHSLGK
ncbi:MAG: HdeD family acid-resistance protein [Candidatus Atribacteria bacterium]|nr:HdeD family acid-resistance protein [Candidatus Atribacteria bacterium]